MLRRSCACFLLFAASCLLPFFIPHSAFGIPHWRYAAFRTPHSALGTQAIPFSHKRHAAEKLKCAVCHEMPGSGERAGFPSTDLCMACHQQIKKESAAIRRLAEYHAKNEPVPWTCIYRLPDFIFFSHARHLLPRKAPAGGRLQKIGCEACHGPVETRDVLSKEKETSMAACVGCHKSRGASIACHLCHELK